MRRRAALFTVVIATMATAFGAGHHPARAAVPGPDVGVSISATPNPVAPGGTITYTVNVTNNDTATPADVTLDVTLIDEPLLVIHEFLDGAPVPVVGGYFKTATAPCPTPPGAQMQDLPDGPVVGGQDYVYYATPVGNNLMCPIPGLAPSTTTSITITAIASRGLNVPSPLIVTTAAVSSTGDPNPMNDVAVAQTCVAVTTPPCVP